MRRRVARHLLGNGGGCWDNGTMTASPDAVRSETPRPCNAPGPSVAEPIRLTRGERQVLQARVARARSEQRDVLRARIVLAAAAKDPNAVIAVELASRSTPSASGGVGSHRHLEGLNDLPRSGRPRVFPSVVTAEVKAIACSLPAEQGLPISAWTCAEIAQEAVGRGVVASVSASTVRRILAEDVIKPWQCRSCIFPRDPDFGSKAGRCWSCMPAVSTVGGSATTST